MITLEDIEKSINTLTRPVPLDVYNNYDPTRTTTLRNAFVRESNRRFRELAAVIRQAVDRDDGFGLRPGIYQLTSPGPGAFAFPRTVDKLAAFERWLQTQTERGLLETRIIPQLGTGIEGAWTDRYIYDSYKRGVMRARYELTKAGYPVPSIEQTGGIEISMSTPFHLERVGVLFTRTFSELKGITAAMDQQISRVLAQGLVDGDGPSLLARKLAATITGPVGDLGLTDTLGRFIPARRRAEIMARTEIIRAHHNATIQEYRNWAVEGVVVKAEWSSAGDERMCNRCADLDGSKFTLDKIEGMIPLHPQCRCIALPYEEKGKVTPTDSVASGFKSANDGKAYSKYKKEYKTFLNKLSKKDLKLLNPQMDMSKLPLREKWDLIAKRDEIVALIKQRFNNDFRAAYEAMFRWQESTTADSPMALKYWASLLESRAGQMVYPDFWTAEMVKDLQTTVFKKGLAGITKEQYLRLRAFNQAYMEYMNIGKEVLWRGNDGLMGEKIREMLNVPGMNRANYTIQDAPLSGYSKVKRKAIVFGADKRGITVEVEVKSSDVFLHRDLMSGVNGQYGEEAEVILMGGKRTIKIQKIIWEKP